MFILNSLKSQRDALYRYSRRGRWYRGRTVAYLTIIISIKTEIRVFICARQERKYLYLYRGSQRRRRIGARQFTSTIHPHRTHPDVS